MLKEIETAVNPGAFPAAAVAKNLLYFAQGSYMPNDKIGTHGGYQESIKTKGINPRYVTRLWSSVVQNAQASTVTINVDETCAPCGDLFYLRVDVKGSPALRFLNHNAYAIGDSSGSAALNNSLPGICCADGQEFLDPAVALAKAAAMLLEDPLIQPFVQEATGGGIVVSIAGVAQPAQTIADTLDGTYTPSVDPVGDQITATLTLEGAYVDTKFGDCSFDTRDHYEMEPVQLFASILDETGDPCNECGSTTRTEGVMQQTTGETVLRHLLLHERYLQSPYHQGASDSVRIREIEGFDAIKAAVDRNALYKVYYIQHSIPRLNNPTGTFDNDQYVYEFFVDSSDAGLIGQMDLLFADIATLCNSPYGNPITFDTDVDAL